MNKVKICSIVAIAQNHAIGKDNGMIWHLPEDLKHFKRTTLGKPVIMGRKSYESLGKPLPGRPNFVVSRTDKDIKPSVPTPIFTDMESVQAGESPTLNEGPFLYSTIAEAINAAKTMAGELGTDEIFITGGGEIYKQTLPQTERLYLTILHRDYEGDVFFPAINWAEWTITEQTDHPADPSKDRPAFTIYTLDRA